MSRQILPTVSETFQVALTTCEDWLSSDEGMEAQKSEYVRRLAELKQVSGPAKMRRDESQNRSAAIASLKATYNKFRLQAMSSDQKYAHIEAAEKQKILTAATEGEEWLEPLVRQQVCVFFFFHRSSVLPSSFISRFQCAWS